MTGIQLHFTGQDRVRAIGRYALALSSGAVSGQILGSVLASADVAGLGWRAVFLVNVPVGIAAVAAALRFLPTDGGAAFAAAENRVARTGRPPLLTMDLLRIPAVRWGLVTMAVATSTYYALMFTFAQYLQGGLGRGPVVSGLTLVPWLAAFGLAGLGLGVEFAAQAGRLTAGVEPRYAADISGASSTLIQVGGAIGVAAIGALYLAGTRGSGSPAVASAHAFAATTGVLAGVALLAAAAAWRASAPRPSRIRRAERAPVASFGPRSRVGS